MVGNIDPERTEQKIKALFSSIKMPENPVKRVYYPVPNNSSIICVVEKDKEQAQASVQLIFKHDAATIKSKGTAAFLVRNFLTDAVSSMLNDRLDELQKQPDVPFTISSTNDDDYLLAKTKKAFTFIAGCEGTKAEASLRILTHEVMRAYDFGLINQVMNIIGVGDFTVDELKKKLAGRNVSATSSIGLEKASLFANSTPQDIRTAFQLLYLNATAPKRDDEAFHSLIKIMDTSLANAGVNPMRALADSVYQTLYDRHPLATMMDTSMVKAVNYDKVLAMYKQIFSNFSGFHFVILGNYNEDSVRTLTERYIASLPTTGIPGKAEDTGMHFAKGRVRNEFYRKMETPQSVNYIVWEKECPYTLENCIMADIIGQAMQMTYLKQIREDNGWAYSLAASGQVSAPDLGLGKPGSALFTVRCPVKPEKNKNALKIIITELENVVRKGIDNQDLSKIKEYLVKTAKDNASDNDYWRTIISKYALYGVDFDTNYIPVVQRVTSSQLRDFAKKYIVSGNRAEIIMHPVMKNK